MALKFERQDKQILQVEGDSTRIPLAWIFGFFGSWILKPNFDQILKDVVDRIRFSKFFSNCMEIIPPPLSPFVNVPLALSD